MFTSQQFEYVLTIWEERSFSKAAKKLYITQPSLSQFVINLEQQLGARIFDRSTSPIGLTQAGEIYIQTARRILSIHEEMLEEFSDLWGLRSGHLRIGASPFRASSLLPEAFVSFRRQYPGVRISFAEESLSDLEQMTLDGQLDLFVGILPLDEKLFSHAPLTEEDLYLMVPPDHPINGELRDYQVSPRQIREHRAEETPCVPLERFAESPFILLMPDQSLSSRALEICRESGFEARAVLRTEQLETAVSMVLAGIGCSFVPDTYVRGGNRENSPCFYRLASPLKRRHVVLAYKKNRYLSRAAQAFIGIMQEQAADSSTFRT